MHVSATGIQAAGVLAAAGPLLLDAKRRRRLGEEEWRRLAHATGRPGNGRALLREMGWRPPVAGLLLYALLILLHPYVIGRNPLP